MVVQQVAMLSHSSWVSSLILSSGYYVEFSMFPWVHVSKFSGFLSPHKNLLVGEMTTQMPHKGIENNVTAKTLRMALSLAFIDSLTYLSSLPIFDSLPPLGA